ncbi:hypothetical protein [Geomonas limicola]|uniref:hypothetical protein n=1 Tax=Geomonas limicola TaxID=2740186 RepID=UPI001620A554|nr:hypothetical protein [Geomonas limicola]
MPGPPDSCREYRPAGSSRVRRPPHAARRTGNDVPAAAPGAWARQVHRSIGKLPRCCRHYFPGRRYAGKL